MEEAPESYTDAGTNMLISGICQIIASISVIVALIVACIGVMWIVPLIVAIIHLIFGIKVMGGKYFKHAKLLTILHLVCSISCLNIISIIMDIKTLIALGKPDSIKWMRAQESAGS